MAAAQLTSGCQLELSKLLQPTGSSAGSSAAPRSANHHQWLFWLLLVILAVFAAGFVIMSKKTRHPGGGQQTLTQSTLATEDPDPAGPPAPDCHSTVRCWFGDHSNKQRLHDLLAEDMKSKMDSMDQITQDCILSHDISKFVDSSLPELVDEFAKLQDCQTLSKDEMSKLVTQKVSVWSDQIIALLVHRCRLCQLDGNLPLAIMQYPDDDSLDAEREMQPNYQTATNSFSGCVRAEFLKSVL